MSGSDSACICNKFQPGRVFAGATISPDTPGGTQMISELEPNIHPSISPQFGTGRDDARAQRTAAALEANGIAVRRAAHPGEARKIVLGLIPKGSQVHHGASQ